MPLSLIIIAGWIVCGVVAYLLLRHVKTYASFEPWTVGDRTYVLCCSLFGPVVLAVFLLTGLYVVFEFMFPKQIRGFDWNKPAKW